MYKDGPVSGRYHHGMLFVGTSGWAYPEWKPGFYPKEVTRGRFLEYYSSQLSACEINATFYKAHEDDVIKRWAQDVPGGFRFAIKAHRSLTHGKSIELNDVRSERLKTFLGNIANLGAKRGPVLFQLPAYRKFDLEGLKSLIEALPTDLLFAFEFRDPSWDDTSAKDLIVEKGGAICLADWKGVAPESLPPGRFAYVRFRADRYAPRRRAAWRKLLEQESSERDVYVFAKHEGVPAGDPFVGVGFASWLERYARKPKESVAGEA